MSIALDGTVTIYQPGGDKTAAELFYRTLEIQGKTLFARITELEGVVTWKRVRRQKDWPPWRLRTRHNNGHPTTPPAWIGLTSWREKHSACARFREEIHSNWLNHGDLLREGHRGVWNDKRKTGTDS